MASQNVKTYTIDHCDEECCPICYEPFMQSVDSASVEASMTREEDCSGDATITTEDCSSCDADTKNNTNESRNCALHMSLERVIIPGCGHEFCLGCLKEHCSFAISIRDLPIRCPRFRGDDSSRPCSAILPMDLVEKCLLALDATNPDWTKFQRLHRMAKDPSLIPCTRCDELISPRIRSTQEGGDNAMNDPNRIQCPKCQHVFCQIYGDDHLVPNCSNGTPRGDDPSEIAILELCKPCSHCGVPIFKEKGCNHVICPICKNDMCFRCGAHEYLETNGTSVRSCKKCNGHWVDHRFLLKHRLLVVAKLPMMLPIYIAYFVMSLGLMVTTLGCFCCLGCGVRCKKKSGTMTTSLENPPTKQQCCDGCTTKMVFMPLMAIREVLRFVLLPFIDLFRDCLFPCCFCHDAPPLCKGRPADEEGDEDDGSHYDNESNISQGDVENQIRENESWDSISTTFDSASVLEAKDGGE